MTLYIGVDIQRSALNTASSSLESSSISRSLANRSKDAYDVISSI